MAYIGGGKQDRARRGATPGGEGLIRASIVVPVHGAPAAVDRCLASLLRHTPEIHEILPIDNASDAETKGLLRTFAAQRAGVRVLENAFNLGYPIACNQGLAAASGDVVILLNSDTEVDDAWVERLAAHLVGDVGIVGPRGTAVSGGQNVADPDAWEPGESWGTDRLVGFCLAIRRDVIERLGGLDPRFGMGNYDDDDYCLRALLAGFRLRVAGDVLVRHVGHASFDAGRVDLGGLLQINRKKFLQKWRLAGLTGSTAAEMVTSWPPDAALDVFIPLPDPAKPHPTVSLCMIVRDEEEFLAGCLESVAAAVDELCIVDTGSTDRTVAIAESFNARVRHLPWTEDFAAARNASLEMATGDRILVLDADERLAPGSAFQVRWLSWQPMDFGAIVQVESSPVLRFFRGDIGVRYVGRVHEQPTLPDGTVPSVDMSAIRIRHLGYEPDIVAARAKTARNLRLAEQMGATDFHGAFNLCRCYWEAERYADVESCAALAQTLTKNPSDIIHAAVMEIAAAGARSDEAALALAIALRDRFPAMPRVAFLVGKILASMERYEEALTALDWRQAPALVDYLSCDFSPPDMTTPGVRLREAAGVYVICARELRRMSAAVVFVGHCIEVTPAPDPMLYELLAGVLNGLGKGQLAGEILNRGLKIAPGSVSGWTLMAEIAGNLNLPDIADEARHNIAVLAA